MQMAIIASIMLTTHLAMLVHPGGNGLQTCINSGSVSCELLPGIHRESVTIPTNSRPVEIIGMRGSVLSGAEPIPDSSWRKHTGSIYKAKLPDSVLGSDIQQAWMGEQVCFEARWPNTNLTHGNRANEVGGPLDAEGSWARTYGIIGQNDSCLNCTRLRQGIIVDPKLAQTGIDWTGATATLNVGFRFLTWTRTVLNHSAGSATFTYNKTTQKSRRGMVGGSGAYLDKGLDNLYFLSGKLAALDAPGEFFVDHDAGIMYLWPTSSSQPAEPPTNVTVKVRNYCVQGRANLTGVRFHGCAFWLKGNGLRVTDTELLYVCTPPRTHTHTHTHTRPSTHTTTHTHTHTHTRPSTHTHTHTHDHPLLGTRHTTGPSACGRRMAGARCRPSRRCRATTVL